MRRLLLVVLVVAGCGGGWPTTLPASPVAPQDTVELDPRCEAIRAGRVQFPPEALVTACGCRFGVSPEPSGDAIFIVVVCPTPS